MSDEVDEVDVPTVPMREQVEAVIAKIRPAIQADNGDIELHDVDDVTGLVTVELVGACVSCPASTVTLKAGIERILKDRVPGVTEVVDAGAAATEIGESAVSL
jgi:Fe-S cluster biogenesis protein NfuA